MREATERGDEAFERELRSFRATSRRRLGLACAAVVLSLALLPVAPRVSRRVLGYLHGETDLAGNPIYEPPHAVDEGALRSIDMRRLHAELIPGWVIAVAQANASNNARGWTEHNYQRLRAALAPDPNVTSLWDELHQLVPADPLSNGRRIDYLIWAYDDYLDRHHEPWRLEATLYLHDTRAVFYTSSYRIVSDLRTPDGLRLRLLRRADPTNVVEGYLGDSTRPSDGAFLVMDRVLHFAARHVWPLMNPALDGRRPADERAFGPAVRQELARALPPSVLAVLDEAAEDQQALIEVAQSIGARKSCGSHFTVWGLPYKGLSLRDQRSLVGALVRSRGSECPEVTLGEAARMVGASERLRQSDDIDVTIDQLAAWVARPVAVHELRHVADGAQGGASCPGCPPGMSDGAVSELSAYVSSFATPGVGNTALLQACTLHAKTGIHARALAFALARLLPNGCEGGPPADLYARARALEVELFGDRPVVRLPRRFPRSVAMMGPVPE